MDIAKSDQLSAAEQAIIDSQLQQIMDGTCFFTCRDTDLCDEGSDYSCHFHRAEIPLARQVS